MKKTILFLPMFLIMSLMVSALNLAPNSNVLTEPYSLTITPANTQGTTWDNIKTNLGIKSCYDQANYESGTCDYIYYCYAIMPTTSTSIYEALQKECVDATAVSSSTGTIPQLTITNFVPPKGIPFYVSSFVVQLRYIYNTASASWTSVNTIPNQYTQATQVRTVCPSGQMLRITSLGYQCYPAQRVCLDTTLTGLCTNQYTLFALDLNQDGIITDAELKDAGNYCVDRPVAYAAGDGICDLVQDLGCTDNVPVGGNGVCDIWDAAGAFACKDDVLSENSKICDSLETGAGICPSVYDPVCVGGRGGTTYPNECFANSLGQTTFTDGSCEPPVTQCYVANDCPDINVCIGGTTTIAKSCLANECAYSGVCSELSCNSNSDCDPLESNICAGVDATCVNSQCTLQGKCITQPLPLPKNKTIFDIIAGIFTALINFIKSLFGF